MPKDEEYAIQEWYCSIEKGSCYNEARCSACELAEEWERVSNGLEDDEANQR